MSPGNVQACRQAIAWAVDRDALAAAVAPQLPQRPSAASTIQHPALPGYAPAQGFAYDPARARELYAQCGYTATLRIAVWMTTTGAMQASAEVVAESIRRTLPLRVELTALASSEMLAFAARTGSMPVWIMDWVSNKVNVGYPSFALGIGATLVSDQDVRALAARGDVRGTEALLLQRALVIPLLSY